MSGAVRIAGEPGHRGSFNVPSLSHPGESWHVEWIGGGSHWCGCPGHAQRQSCRHTEAVQSAVIAEARALVAQSTPEQRALAAARLAQLEEQFAR